ncbi:MAG: hypothetical protein K2L13_02025, partial [Opitutales bacterium]|nr:hypothetical protein [Opitutales bacterium]
IMLCVLCLTFATCAYVCLKSPLQLESVRNWLLYDKRSTLILFGSATVILLYKILHLSTADFGEYKNLLLILFSTICVLSFFKVRELLSVRGLAILMLFFCDYVLDILQASSSILNNILVFVIYIVIVFNIVIGSVPYLLRDWLDHLIEHKDARKVFGYLFSASAFVTLAMIL